MHPIIETSGLTKRYGNFTAVDHVDLHVNPGEVYGFLGLNGAGKTTTIRMLLGMIRPTAGTARLLGSDVQKAQKRLWNAVGYLVETPWAYPELTVWENLEMFRRLRQIPENAAVDATLERLRLTPYRNRRVAHLSLGNAQRLGIAKALLHHPSILILDEPANGLDPAGIVELRDMLLDLSKNQGVTVFVSSHILGEVAKFAGRIGIIHEARLVRELDASALAKVLKKRLVIETVDPVQATGLLEKAAYAPQQNAQGQIELSDPKALDAPEQVNALLVRAGCLPKKLNVEEEDLESYFLRSISEKGGGQ